MKPSADSHLGEFDSLGCRLLKAGFTLIELLVVIAIIAILAALFFPALSRTLDAGNRAKCGENVRRMLSAVHMYASENDGNLPYCHVVGGQYGGGFRQYHWHRAISPYFGINWTDQWYEDLNDRKVVLPDIYHCPSDKIWGANNPVPVNPSYGYNYWLAKNVDLGDSTKNSPPSARTNGSPVRAAAVSKPSEMILIADRPHDKELNLDRQPNAGATWWLAYNIPDQRPLDRHHGYGTVGWLDGHVTLETTARLKELSTKPKPWGTETYNWSHWTLPPP